MASPNRCPFRPIFSVAFFTLEVSQIGIRATLWIAAGSWLVLCALVLCVREVRTMRSLAPVPDDDTVVLAG